MLGLEDYKKIQALQSSQLVQDTDKRAKGRLAVLIGTGAAGVLVATVGAWEGFAADPYADKLAHGILTVCYGDTQIEMRHYTKAECQEILADRLADYAAPVLAKSPELKGHPDQTVAAVSFAYNAGVANYGKSSVARLFKQGKWVSACNALMRWTYSGGKKRQGLVNRRNAERLICLKNIPADKAL